MRIAPHEKFTRDGYDLNADLLVSALVIASGGEVVYETLLNTVKFRIPLRIGDGDQLRLEQQGVPRLYSSDVGD